MSCFVFVLLIYAFFVLRCAVIRSILPPHAVARSRLSITKLYAVYPAAETMPASHIHEQTVMSLSDVETAAG